jgi:geranyl-CoA carboxylase alpha subunit
VHLKEGANIHVLDVRSTRSGRYAVRTPQGDVAVAIEGSLGGTGAVADIDGSRRPFVGRFGEDGLHLQMGGRSAVFRDVLRDTAAREAKDGAGRLLAPMNGRVVRVLAERGDTVAKGQCVVILEAMKMQHEIAAGRAGRIAALNVAEGQQVATRTVLAELVEDQNPR